MNSIQGIIFDIDGTLLDSNDFHAQAFCRAFQEAGYSYSIGKIRRLIGMGGDHLLPTLSGLQANSKEGKKITQRKKEIFMQEFLPQLKPFPKAKELVQTLRNKGLKIAIATSGKKDELEIFLKIIGIQDLIETKTTSDDAKQSKPSPDIVLATLNQLGLSSDRVLMVGDTPYDIEAAQKAGVRTIALQSGGWDKKDLKGALLIYQNPADFLSHLDELFRVHFDTP